MAITFKPYQIDSLNRMRNGCILKGGVGSGKSLTSIAYYYIQQGGEMIDGRCVPDKKLKLKDLYIITTAQKRDLFEWDKELTHFLMSQDSKHNLYSNKVVIDSWNNVAKYKDVENSFFIFDEQRVVGSGPWAKAFIKISKKNNWILLSATPGDNWMDYIPVFIANGFYKNKTEFIDKHVVYKWNRHANYPSIDRFLNTKKLLYLRDSILIDMDFERKTTQNHLEIFTNYDQMKYKEVGRMRWNIFKDQPIQNAGELCYTWRRVVNEDISRQVKLLEIFEDHPRVIIFYNFNYELEILRGLKYGDDVIVAEWNRHKHQPVPDSKRWVYLVQYNAGSEGWNCLTTDTIIFYSQSYSYRTMTQAAGRIDRVNTPFRDLYYYHFKTKSPIDLAISRALKTKKKFNESKFVGSFK